MVKTSLLNYAKSSEAKMRKSHCHLFWVITQPSWFALVSLDEQHDYVHRGPYTKKELANQITAMRTKLIQLKFNALPELPLEKEATFFTDPLYYHTLGKS
jgi:hypothetical protein